MQGSLTPQKGHFRLVARPGPVERLRAERVFLMMIAGAGGRLHQLHLLIGPFQALREISPTLLFIPGAVWGSSSGLEGGLDGCSSR